ncbi:hypothetical protein DQ04_18361000, partial [Trypanosoma grayi]|uniref:hypothetical protein n=1 Tax=Trypanosoma grayi TaxID=71804 RepID=UPI0004F493DD
LPTRSSPCGGRLFRGSSGYVQQHVGTRDPLCVVVNVNCELTTESLCKNWHPHSYIDALNKKTIGVQLGRFRKKNASKKIHFGTRKNIFFLAPHSLPSEVRTYISLLSAVLSAALEILRKNFKPDRFPLRRGCGVRLPRALSAPWQLLHHRNGIGSHSGAAAVYACHALCPLLGNSCTTAMGRPPCFAIILSYGH